MVQCIFPNLDEILDVFKKMNVFSRLLELL